MTPSRMTLGLLSALLLTTFGLLLLQHLGPERTLRLDAESVQSIANADDRGSGGETLSSLERKDGRLELNCLLRAGFSWPFCQMDLILAAPDAGFDLSRFRTMNLSLSLESDTDLDRIRLFIRNYDADYVSRASYDPLKVNKIEISVTEGNNPISLELRHFRVADWWLQENRVALEHTVADMSSVPMIQIATGSGAPLGQYRIVLDYIEFSGPWVRNEVLYGTLLALWSSAALLLLFRLLWRYRLALRDPLTGALNRNAFRDLLQVCMRQQRREGRPASLIFMDLDHFKDLNDQYGHNAGDEVLRRFSGLLREHLRDRDQLIRWGGEEFLLLCPDTRVEDAEKLAEELRQRVERFEWPEGASVTCSFGVTSLHQETAEQLIERADRALYLAKAAGRNCVTVG